VSARERAGRIVLGKRVVKLSSQSTGEERTLRAGEKEVYMHQKINSGRPSGGSGPQVSITRRGTPQIWSRLR